MNEVLVWKVLDWGFDLWVMGMKRDEIINQARAKQEAGATGEEMQKWLQDLRKQKATEARKEVADSPDD